MAALDFPNTPTDQQLFAAPNGITYQWQATPGVWIVYQGGVQTGDFCATGTSLGTIGNFVVTGLSVLSGNLGSWYNPTTGRYTPPAGRYRIDAGFYAAAAGGSTLIEVSIRKNGVILPGTQLGQTTPGANLVSTAQAAVAVDANGTDYFEMWVRSYNFSATSSQVFFAAFPILGAVGPPGPVGPASAGDFTATFQSGGGIPTSDTTLVLPTVATGNSGGWYSNSTGRFTPPAGRFFLFAEYMATQTAGSHCSVSIRKNGAAIQYNRGSVAGNGYYANPSVLIQADANGTDWFDMQISANAGAQGSWFVFGAFPITGIQGIQGPPGPGNAWRILSRQTPTAVGFVELQNIPSDVNELMCNVDLIPSSNTGGLMAQVYDNAGVLDTGAHYAWSNWVFSSAGAANAGPGSSSGTSTGFNTGFSLSYGAVGNLANYGISANFKIANIRASKVKQVNFQMTQVDASNTITYSGGGGGLRNVATSITGLRMFFNGMNIASGSFEVWGSP
jgi:hypothetical protein